MLGCCVKLLFFCVCVCVCGGCVQLFVQRMGIWGVALPRLRVGFQGLGFIRLLGEGQALEHSILA